MNGRTTIRMIHPALAHPDKSSRRRTSAKSEMNIQITVNQKKKMSVDQRKVPNVQSTAGLPLTFVVGSQSSVVDQSGASSGSGEIPGGSGILGRRSLGPHRDRRGM